MSLQNITTEATLQKSPLISNEVKKVLEIYIHVITFIVTSLIGIGANIVNIIVYWKHGLKDSITIGFFALSMSDLLVVLCPLVTASCYAAKKLAPSDTINYPFIHYVSAGWFRNMVYSLSCTITILLAAERSCCIAFPFKVRELFTRSRTIVAIVGLLVFHVVCFLPIFATHRLEWVTVGSGNDTTVKLLLWFADHRREIEHFNATLMGIVLPAMTQVVVTIGAIIMINGLRKSARFRQKMNQTQYEKKKDDNNEENEDPKSTNMSKRDAKLTKTMVFLVAILSSCNIPFLAMALARRFVPELNIGRAYQNTFSVSDSIVYILGTINATANMFVYYNTNSKYKQIVQENLCKRLKA